MQKAHHFLKEDCFTESILQISKFCVFEVTSNHETQTEVSTFQATAPSLES